jgi:hypothetical protein
MLDPALEERLVRLAHALVDQDRAEVIVAPNQPASGFWFGGGNASVGSDGAIYVIGRYRNAGDSRTGLSLGERGLELAVFRAKKPGSQFEKVQSWTKSELNIADREVLSIEGSALRWTNSGVEIFVSTEKSGIPYPAAEKDFLKPGAGVWTIERIAAANLDDIKTAKIETVLEASDPQFIHIKDPFLYQRCESEFQLLFCSHPFSWTSSNTGYATVGTATGQVGSTNYNFFPRGFTWDVAMTRGTCVIDVPRVGKFADRDVSLMFYDGGESLRDLDEHSSAVKRPRGYSCEELGGAAYIQNGQLASVERLSRTLPFFISPQGTGCSRYVDALQTPDGIFATWQQSQSDKSQPLVANFVSNDQIETLLS